MTHDPADGSAASFPEPAAAPPARLSGLKILSPDTRDAMDRIGERVAFAAGSVILHEGERSNDLYVIESGEVVGVRSGGEGDEQWPVLHLKTGDIVGEHSFMDGGPQQLTARAVSDCEVLKVNPFDLLELEDGDHFYDNLRASVGLAVVQRLRVGSDVYVSTLRHQLETAKTQQQFGKFFLFVLGLCAVGMVGSYAIATRMLDVDIYTQAFAWQYLAVLLVPSLGAMWAVRVPLDQIGLTRRNLRESLAEGLALSGLLIAATAAFIVVSNTSDALPDRPFLFDPSGVLPYFMHSFLQELVARGFMQTSVQRFLNDRKGYVSVAVTSVFFGVFHLHFGLAAVATLILSSLVFGAFYLRHHNLAGVTLFHFTIGACAFATGIL